jgi:nuclear GTP-binding protein
VRALHKVLEEADIILLVLDARDPDGCRSRLVEEEVRRREADGKRLVFVLNKIGMHTSPFSPSLLPVLYLLFWSNAPTDLVPKENAQAWLRHLRHSTPTLPFRSASNGQRSNLSSATAPALMRLLKAFKPSARSATVGVVGYPNVGKSSLINALKRSKVPFPPSTLHPACWRKSGSHSFQVCAVASTPGHTRELQSIALERGLRIVDSPGVVFDDADLAPDGHKTGARASSVLLRNVVRVEDVPDPVEVVEAILERTPAERVQAIYGVPPFADARELLTMLALTSGRLLKACAFRSVPFIPR